MNRKEREDYFVQVWNDSCMPEEVAATFNRTTRQVIATATGYRCKGRQLRRFRSGPRGFSNIFIPTPEEIKEGCKRARDAWTAEMRIRRLRPDWRTDGVVFKEIPSE